MPVVQRVDQLHVNDHTITCPPHTSLQHVRYSKGFADLAQVTHRRIAKLNHR